MTTWGQVWERKGLGATLQPTLSELLQRDGFDSGGGNISEAVWQRYVDWVLEKVDLPAARSVLEVGSGAVAFLYALMERGSQVTGTDYSASLIAAARAAMPGGRFFVHEARHIAEIDGSFDVVMANSVFQYFPDQPYAHDVLQGMLAKATSTVAILDVYDAAQREEMEAVRRAGLTEAAYTEKYRGLAHQYYERAWFEAAGGASGCEVEVVDQPKWLCDVSKCRFCVFIRK